MSKALSRGLENYQRNTADENGALSRVVWY